MMVISMAQNVYMLSMAFLVPLRRLKAKYVCPQTKEDKNDDRVTALDTPFVLYPNASCRCWVIEGGADIYPVTSNVLFYDFNDSACCNWYYLYYCHFGNGIRYSFGFKGYSANKK